MDNQDIENAIVSREDVRGPSIETQAKIETSDKEVTSPKNPLLCPASTPTSKATSTLTPSDPVVATSSGQEKTESVSQTTMSKEKLLPASDEVISDGKIISPPRVSMARSISTSPSSTTSTVTPSTAADLISSTAIKHKTSPPATISDTSETNIIAEKAHQLTEISTSLPADTKLIPSLANEPKKAVKTENPLPIPEETILDAEMVSETQKSIPNPTSTPSPKANSTLTPSDPRVATSSKPEKTELVSQATIFEDKPLPASEKMISDGKVVLKTLVPTTGTLQTPHSIATSMLTPSNAADLTSSLAVKIKSSAPTAISDSSKTNNDIGKAPKEAIKTTRTGNQKYPNDVLTWSSTDRGKFIRCDGADTIVRTEEVGSCSLIRTSKCIPASINSFYFESTIVRYSWGESRMGIGFTTSVPELRDKYPGKDSNTLALEFRTHWLYGGDGTISYGVKKEVGNINDIKDGDIIGCLLRRVRIGNKTYNVCRFSINGSNVGHPLINGSKDLYPTIWLDSPGDIVKCNLGCKEFKFKDKIENGEELDVERLWDWQPTRKDGPLEFNGTHVTFQGVQEEGEEEKVQSVEEDKKNNATVSSGRGRILSSNPVPLEFETFSFQVKVDEGLANKDIAVGYTTSTRSVIYEGFDGSISKEYFDFEAVGRQWNYTSEFFWGECYKKKRLAAATRFELNDMIECCLWKKKIVNRNYNVIFFKKNGRIVGEQALEGNIPIWPVIEIGSPATQVSVDTNIKGTTFEEKSESAEKKQNSSCSPRCSLGISSAFSGKPIWMILWRAIIIITSILTVPLLCLTRRKQFSKNMVQLWTPKDPKLMTISYILNYILPVVDVASDIYASASYFENLEHVWFGSTTLVVTFLPFLVKLLQELTYTLRCFFQDYKVFQQHTGRFVRVRIKNVAKHLPFIQPIVNLYRLIRLGKMKENEVRAEKLLMKMGEDSNLETFLESAPQTSLQIFIAFQTQKLPLPIIWSMMTSILSVGVASASTFLFERLEYPVGMANFTTKIFLALFFMVGFISRSMAISLLANFFGDWSGSYNDKHLEKICIPLFVILLLLILRIALHFGSCSKLPAKPVWNADLGDDTYIKGEYQSRERHGYESYSADLRRKSLFISFFSPCIILCQNSRVFEITAYVSTAVYTISVIMGWILCGVHPDFGLHYNATMANTTNSSITKDDWLQTLFPLMLGLLILSFGAQAFLTFVSDHTNLYHATRGTFMHPCLVAIAMERLAQKENDMEIAARAQNEGNWRKKLIKLYSEDDLENESKKSAYLFLQELCWKGLTMQDPVVIAKTAETRKVSRTPFELINQLRFAEDTIGSVIVNIERNLIKNQLLTATKNDLTKTEQRSLLRHSQEEDPKMIYSNIQSCDCGCDDVDMDGNTPLLIALKEGNMDEAERLLLNGGSVIHKNKKGFTAFPLAFSPNGKKIQDLLWFNLKHEDACDLVFSELCSLGNTEALKYCLDTDNSNDQLKKKMLTFIVSGYWHCPLYHAMNEDNKQVVDFLLPYYKEIIPELLTDRDGEKNNPLIRATKEGHVGVVKHLLPVYREKKILGEFGSDNYTALMMSIKYERTEIFHILMDSFEHEGLVTTSNQKNESAITCLVLCGNEEMAKRLAPHYMESSPQLLTKYYDGRNHLDWAVQDNKVGIVKHLLPLYKKHKLLGEFNKYDKNVLMTASYYGNLEILDILLPYFEEEGLVKGCNTNNKSALTIARDGGEEKIVERLEPFFKEAN